MPDLLGQPPFGGHILSHDFVEAALLRRAGWGVYLVTEVTGSYEESPPSLIDFAERDRRWCQGNLQHSRIVPARGLYWMSRLHLAMGIMSYLASPIWLVFIALGLLLALQAHFIRPEYFPQDFALFPTWPVFDSERAVRLFVVTMAVLVAPKLFGYALLCKDRQLARRYGGFFRAGMSVLFETILSAFIAPVMMVMQSAVVVGILTGRAVGWTTQHRDDGSIPLRAVARRHRGHTVIGVVLALAAYAVSPCSAIEPASNGSVTSQRCGKGSLGHDHLTRAAARPAGLPMLQECESASSVTLNVNGAVRTLNSPQPRR